MLITGIRSKPVYAPLQPDLQGRFHLMVGHGVGGAPLLRVLQQLQQAESAAPARTRVLYVADATACEVFATQYRAANVSEVRLFNDDTALLTAFESVLQGSLMGTRLRVSWAW